MGRREHGSDDLSTIDRYVTAALFVLLLGGALSALGVGPSQFAASGLPVPDWRLGVVAALLFAVGLVRSLSA